MTSKKQSGPAMINWILGITFAIIFAFMGIVEFRPDLMDGIMKPRVSEQNFVKELVLAAKDSAKEFPAEKKIVYVDADGKRAERAVIIYGYTVTTDGSACAEYYKPEDNTRLVQTALKACVAPPHEEKADEPGFIDRAIRCVSEWSFWKYIGELECGIVPGSE